MEVPFNSENAIQSKRVNLMRKIFIFQNKGQKA